MNSARYSATHPPIPDRTEADRLASALQDRQTSKLYSGQVELLAKFDRAPVAEKRRMLGKYWPKWRDYVAQRYPEQTPETRES